MNKIVTRVLAAAVLTAGIVTPAVAAPVPSPTEDGRVYLSVRGTDPATGPWTEEVWLDCPGEEGMNHPHREGACTALDYADGNLDRLPGDKNRVCPTVHEPVTATAHGTYEGREVHWEQTFPSNCELLRATGDVFLY
ncbi:SSI family serine proteinase inhibitor [Streptomyces sp. SBC-4]|nr:SSI family serine proteinase inhibitor [Streptomyces sp. SBC-4]MDV5143302.1 SSI family serine proteinase inhibitor [Streptomyces sp. SBC-4]